MAAMAVDLKLIIGFLILYGLIMLGCGCIVGFLIQRRRLNKILRELESAKELYKRQVCNLLGYTETKWQK